MTRISRRHQMLLSPGSRASGTPHVQQAETIYQVPLAFQEQQLHLLIQKRLFGEQREPDMENWGKLVYKVMHPQKTIHIALAGKYTHLTDSYMSVIEALQHA